MTPSMSLYSCHRERTPRGPSRAIESDAKGMDDHSEDEGLHNEEAESEKA